MTETIDLPDVDAKTFATELNKLRLRNKNKWVFARINVNGKVVEYKAYNTWIQIMRMDGKSHPSPMDMKPTAFQLFLLDFAERYLPKPDKWAGYECIWQFGDLDRRPDRRIVIQENNNVEASRRYRSILVDSSDLSELETHTHQMFDAAHNKAMEMLYGDKEMADIATLAQAMCSREASSERTPS